LLRDFLAEELFISIEHEHKFGMTSSAMSSQNVMCFQRKWHSLPLNEEFASLKIASHYTCTTILVRKPHDLQARGDSLGAGSRATILTSTASDLEAPTDDDRS
jgi:hypothetical protein